MLNNFFFVSGQANNILQVVNYNEGDNNFLVNLVPLLRLSVTHDTYLHK
jgi:hypothetical protein